MKNPKFSIITVSFNSEKTIEKTILSVLNQTFRDFEYIIIDGGSTDETIGIINKYKDKIAYFVSEKDEGIYNAMNKGIDIAKGSYINFMNSDDYFFNNNVLEKISKFTDQEYDVIYGSTEVRGKIKKNIKKAKKIKNLWKGSINHQSSFIRSETIKKHKYNENNTIVADFEFFLKLQKNKGIFKKTDIVIASYFTGGLSGKNSIKTLEETRRTSLSLENKTTHKIYFMYKKNKYILKRYVKKLIKKYFFK